MPFLGHPTGCDGLVNAGGVRTDVQLATRGERKNKSTQGKRSGSKFYRYIIYYLLFSFLRRTEGVIASLGGTDEM